MLAPPPGLPMETDERPGLMPNPVDVRDGIDNRQQRAMIEAALFDEAPAPIKIGRFTIVRRIGEGGMGVVYMAYDEELDRRVAVKLLRGAADGESEGSARLVREAQAMARLSHPNVVTVHEVGTFEGQIFVAMEFVAGADLRQWLKAEPRGWAQTVSCFVQAGQGLAAAHEAGLVHRDFKPDNVLVGDDLRVRVADFGLAHSHGELEPESPRPAADPDSEPSAISLTATGAVLGTPGYMAPEQLQGLATDERADQFSFCVALYEGLYAERPFAGKTVAALAVAIEAGTVRAAPPGSEVPPWLRTALIRGLSADPRGRWPSMQALLAMLSNDPVARRRRRLKLGALGLSVAAALASLGWLAVDGIHEGARQAYWATLTERLLEIERSSATARAADDAVRARDSARLSVVDRYGSGAAPNVTDDPTIAAAVLRDVEGEVRNDPRWIALANVTLGEAISHVVLTDHRDLVTGLVFGPSDPMLYSSSADGTVRRWSMQNSEAAGVVIKHDKSVTALALDPTGKMLASGSEDHSIGLWATEAEPGSARYLRGHTGPVRTVTFGPAGRRLVSASDDGTARLWQVDGESSTAVSCDGAQVTAATFDPTGARVATTSNDHHTRVWNADNGALVATLKGHTNVPYAVRFADGGDLLTAADDGTVRRWTYATDAQPTSVVIARHEGAVTSFDVHDEQILTTAVDASARLWTIDGTAGPVLGGHTSVVWKGLLSPDGASAVTTGWDNTVRVHSTSGPSSAEVLRGHRMRVMSAALHNDGRWLATGSFDGVVRVWDLDRPRTRWTLAGHTETVWTAAIDPSGGRLVTGSHDGTARLWNIDSGAALGVLKPPGAQTDAITAIAFSPDGGSVITGSSRGRVHDFDTATRAVHTAPSHARDVLDLAFDPAGTKLATASLDGTATIRDATTGETLHVLRGETEGTTIAAGVSRVQWAREGDRLFTAGHDGVLRVWGADDGTLRSARNAHDDQIVDMVLNPATGAPATSSKDGLAKLWPNTDGGDPVVLRGHSGTVSSIAFSPDGLRVVTASQDATARVWDARSGALLFTLSGHTAPLWDACFSDDGDWVFTASDDGSVRGWAPGRLDGAAVQWDHDGPVVGLWLAAERDRVVSISSDRTARIWRSDGLQSDASALQAELRAATRYCIPAEQRMRELGEDRARADAAVERCLAR